MCVSVSNPRFRQVVFAEDETVVGPPVGYWYWPNCIQHLLLSLCLYLPIPPSRLLLYTPRGDELG